MLLTLSIYFDWLPVYIHIKPLPELSLVMPEQTAQVSASQALKLHMKKNIRILFQ